MNIKDILFNNLLNITEYILWICECNYFLIYRYKYLCGATPAGIFLMQWYDPLNKFMLLKHFDCVLPSPLNVFKMVITPEMEYPMVCVSVKQPYQQNKLKLDLINMNSGASWFHSDELEDMDGSGIISYMRFCYFVTFLLSSTILVIIIFSDL